MRTTLLVIAVLALAPAGADKAKEARRKAAENAATGLQNNVGLRRTLIGKWLKSADDDKHVKAAEQYRQIMRIQVEKFGPESAEAAAVRQEGVAFAREHGLDQSLVIYVHANDEHNEL